VYRQPLLDNEDAGGRGVGDAALAGGDGWPTPPRRQRNPWRRPWTPVSQGYDLKSGRFFPLNNVSNLWHIFSTICLCVNRGTQNMLVTTMCYY
jgi:hypothetical protein